MLGTPLIVDFVGGCRRRSRGALGLTLRCEKLSTKTRVFETHRIASLERGLELKGGSGSSGTKYRAQSSAESNASENESDPEALGRSSGGHTTLGHEVVVKVLRAAHATAETYDFVVKHTFKSTLSTRTRARVRSGSDAR